MKRHSISKVRTAYGISEYRLGNGLRVLYKKAAAAPVAAVCVTFHVGSRNEAPGHTGSTHILEHLLFKDSKKFNAKNGNAITDYLEWFGSYVNATTWLDRTNYFELVPRERIREALELEADRMRGSLFSEADLASEMTVVRNEYERGRNNPFELLDEAMMAEAFTTHPYRIPTIGTKEDIEGSTAQKLREFYDTFYWPNNATLSIIGDVSWREAEKYILKYFGPIPPSPHPIPKMEAIEPAQTARRAVSLEEPLGISIASLMYKVPEATHKDFAPLVVASMILGGGFSSRLHRALVDTGKAAEVSVAMPPLNDPGVLSVVAHLANGVPHASALAAMRTELKRLSGKAPAAQELRRAKDRIISTAAFQKDGVLREARALSEAIAAGDWTLDYRLEKEVGRVSAKDVMRVAKKYFVPAGETSGVLLDASFSPETA